MSFPKTLDMRPFTKSGQSQQEEDSANNDEFIYELTGVVVHSGTASSGHYWCLIRRPETDEWIECNDSNITSFDESRLAEVNETHTHTHTLTQFVTIGCYTFFYLWSS